MSGFRPGGLGDKGGSTTPPQFAGSLADAIEHQLHDLLKADTGKEPFQLDDNSPDARARRALLVAIARGVVDHLKDHASDGWQIIDGKGFTCRVTVTVDES